MIQSSRRGEVILTAAKLFRKRGYAATSIRDIAAELGIKSPSLYNHISSKQEVLQVILMSMANLYTKGMKDIAASPLRSIDKLERIISDQVRITIEHTDAVSLIPNEWVHLEDDMLEAFLQLRNEYETNFRKIFIQAIEDGYLKDVNVDIATFSILSTLRWLYSWYARNSNINPLQLETELIQNLIGGLRK